MTAPSPSMCSLNSMPSRTLATSLCSRDLAIEQGLPGDILAVELEQVERHQRDFPIVLLGVDQVEARHAVLVVDDAFAVEQDGLHLEPADGLDDARESGA